MNNYKLRESGPNTCLKYCIFNTVFITYLFQNMLGTMLDSGNTLVKSWEEVVETEGGIADIKVDDYVKTFTSSIASIAMFGRYEAEESVLFSKCRDLMEVSGSPTVVDGRPFYR